MWARRRSIPCLICALVLTSSAVAEEAVGPPAILSKDDLLAGVQDAWFLMFDLRVSYTEDLVTGPKQNLFYRSHKTVIIRGARRYVDHEYRSGGDSAKTFERVVAYNGQQTTLHQAHRRMAVISTEWSDEADTQGAAWFDLAMLNPPREGHGHADQSLVSLLGSPYSSIRPELEFIDGNACYVVDLEIPATGDPGMTVWVDASHGFVPLRQVYYSRSGTGSLVMEFEIERATEIFEGLWLPIVGRKVVYSQDTVEGPQAIAYERRIDVDGWESGEPALNLNTGVDDEFFDLWKRLPAGTKVWDKDRHSMWIVGAEGDREPEVATAKSEPAADRATPDSVATQVSPPSPSADEPAEPGDDVAPIILWTPRRESDQPPPSRRDDWNAINQPHLSRYLYRLGALLLIGAALLWGWRRWRG